MATDIDLVIPMTHQLMYLDRNLAKEKIGFPLILGGHDHDPFLETIENCTIVKTGMDAKKIAVIEIIWNTAAGSEQPVIKVVLNESNE